jgi:hypothetical protein
MASSEQRQDRRIVFWIAGSIFGLIVLFSIFGPRTVAADSRPSSTNAQARGVKAAYLLLSELGYSTARWTTPETGLREVDPTRTTLILAEPQLPLRDKKMLEDAIADFLSRGGRVLATGESGAQLLPGGQTALSTRAQLLPGRGGGKGQLAEAAELCQTHPESSGVLARAGKVTLEDGARWTAEGPQYKVEQRCGPDAVVVAFPYGKGEAIWWSAPTPLSNGGLSAEGLLDENGEQKAAQEANLRLVLASVGAPKRRVLFDEYLQEFHEGLIDDPRELPWWGIFWQCLAVALLLLFSFSRRNGPIRLPLTLPRSSPIEFALSMGRLYERAGATDAAIAAAHGRLLQFLREQCGVAPEILRAGPMATAEVLQERFGGDWLLLRTHLEQAVAQMEQARTQRAGSASAKVALRLVQALEADERALQAVLGAGRHPRQNHPQAVTMQ